MDIVGSELVQERYVDQGMKVRSQTLTCMSSLDYRVSLNLLAGLKPSCNQASALHRWIGELIAELTTLRKVEVAPRALPLLRCLVAACDLAENFAVSGNRAIFLFQAFQRWGIFDSEEDNHDDGTIGNIMEHIVMAATRLIPFIQDASGSHWEYIFDTADYLIEVSRIST